MEINGKIIELLPEKSGQSANGTWRKQEYILETNSQYPKKVCFMAWGDKIDQFAIKQGESLVVSVDLESREYNGRWYTDVKAWKVSRDGTHDYSQAHPNSDMGETPDFRDPSDDEIPFQFNGIVCFKKFGVRVSGLPQKLKLFIEQTKIAIFLNREPSRIIGHPWIY